MPAAIILLTGATEAPYLTDALRSHADDLRVEHVADTETLCRAVETAKDPVRLIAFSTNVIVPKPCIDTLNAPAYNFHAGPPAYPGVESAAFAVHEGAATFGVTVHEIASAVDSGQIVHTETFPVDAGITGADLQGQAYQALLEAFFTLAKRLASDFRPLPRISETWSGPVRTRREAERLRNEIDGLNADEIARRRRAFGPPNQ